MEPAFRTSASRRPALHARARAQGPVHPRANFRLGAPVSPSSSALQSPTAACANRTNLVPPSDTNHAGGALPADVAAAGCHIVRWRWRIRPSGVRASLAAPAFLSVHPRRPPLLLCRAPPSPLRPAVPPVFPPARLSCLPPPCRARRPPPITTHGRQAGLPPPARTLAASRPPFSSLAPIPLSSHRLSAPAQQRPWASARPCGGSGDGGSIKGTSEGRARGRGQRAHAAGHTQRPVWYSDGGSPRLPYAHLRVLNRALTSNIDPFVVWDASGGVWGGGGRSGAVWDGQTRSSAFSSPVYAP